LRPGLHGIAQRVEHPDEETKQAIFVILKENV
jgi:hypothetical protein